MTHIVKQFIALADISFLRIDCSDCKASLSLPIMSTSFSIPQHCPSCREEWYQTYANGPNAGERIAELVRHVKAVQRVFEQTDVKFRLELEVSGLSVSPVSSSRDV